MNNKISCQNNPVHLIKKKQFLMFFFYSSTARYDDHSTNSLIVTKAVSLDSLLIPNFQYFFHFSPFLILFLNFQLEYLHLYKRRSKTLNGQNSSWGFFVFFFLKDLSFYIYHFFAAVHPVGCQFELLCFSHKDNG